MKKVFELLDEMKEQHDNIIETWNEKEEISESMLVGWVEQNTELLIELANKVDEINERMDKLKEQGKKGKLFF